MSDDLSAWEDAGLGEDAKSSLEQGDIDALFGGTPQEPRYGSVVEQIIKESIANYDKLPMLNIVFDRLVMMMTASLKRLTTANADITVEGMNSMRFAEAMSNVPLPGLLAIVNADPWGGQFIIAIDAPLLYASLEMMLGGRKSSGSGRADGRSFTAIERRLAEKLMDTILKDFETAFEPLSEVTFSIERVEANPQFASVAQANSPAVHAAFEASLDGKPGRIEFVMPYSTIDPIRDILQKVFLGEKLGGDPAWQNHLREEVKAATVVLEANLHEYEDTLGRVLQWQTGDTLKLHIPADQPASITCGKIPMFSGRMGQLNGGIALKIEADLGNKEEMVDAVARR